MGFGLEDLQDDIRVRPQFPCVLDDLDTCIAVGRITKLGGGTGPRLHTNIIPKFLKTTRRLRSQGHALFFRVDFLWNANFHLLFSPIGSAVTMTASVWIMKAQTGRSGALKSKLPYMFARGCDKTAARPAAGSSPLRDGPGGEQ